MRFGEWAALIVSVLALLGTAVQTYFNWQSRKDVVESALRAEQLAACSDFVKASQDMASASSIAAIDSTLVVVPTGMPTSRQALESLSAVTPQLLLLLPDRDHGLVSGMQQSADRLYRLSYDRRAEDVASELSANGGFAKSVAQLTEACERQFRGVRDR